MDREKLRGHIFQICFGEKDLPSTPSSITFIHPVLSGTPVFEPLTYNFFEAESKATPFLIEISPYGLSSA